MSATTINTETAAIEATPRIKRLTEFATDTAQMADQRRDFDLRDLVDDLYRDLIDLEGER
jgi:hypothetical protein